jgi:hypothetical protein
VPDSDVATINKNLRNAGIQNFNYSPTQTIEAQTIADMNNMTPIPFQPMPVGDMAQANALVGSVGQTQDLQSQYTQQAKEEQQAIIEMQNQKNQLASQFNLPETYRDLQKEAGIPGITKQLQQANLQLAQMQSQYQMTNQELAQQTVPQAFVIGQQNELAKTAAIQIGAQAAYVQALQGNLDLANHYVDKMIDLQAKDFEVKYNAMSDNINLAMKFLDNTLQKEAQQVQFKLDLQKADYSNMLDVKKSSMQNALLNGADSGTIQAIANAQTTEEVYSAAGRYAVDPTVQAQLETERLQQQVLRLNIAEKQQGEKPSPQSLAQSQNNIQQISNLVSNPDLKKAVGTNVFGRISPLEAFTGAKANAIADIEQIISQLSIDSLISAKERGATFGALSDSELRVLSNSATKLASYRITDKEGKVKGYKANEQDFKTELDKINNFAKLDYLMKGGNIADIGATVTDDGKVWVKNSDGTLTSLN